MKIKIDFIDSEINFDVSNIYSLEIYNKSYLYRLSMLLHLLSEGEILEEIIAFDKNNEEIKLSNNIRMFINYFDFNFDSKKYSTDITKHVLLNMEDYDKEAILSSFIKLCNLVDSELVKSQLPITVSIEEEIDTIIKMLKLKINQKENLLDNLLLIIDLEVALNSKKVLCFLNLKQYLTKEELYEFYKYATYNSIYIIMIDSAKYDYINEYEKIIIIDDNLDECVII